MAEETDNTAPASSNRLPSLPKKRSQGPFHRLEELTEIGDPPQDLRLQAQRDPPKLDAGEAAANPAINPKPSSAAAPRVIRDPEQQPAPGAEPDQKPEQMVLQTTMQIDKAQAFKMHCIRNRTTVREELRRLVDQLLDEPSVGG